MHDLYIVDSDFGHMKLYGTELQNTVAGFSSTSLNVSVLLLRAFGGSLTNT